MNHFADFHKEMEGQGEGSTSKYQTYTPLSTVVVPVLNLVKPLSTSVVSANSGMVPL